MRIVIYLLSGLAAVVAIAAVGHALWVWGEHRRLAELSAVTEVEVPRPLPPIVLAEPSIGLDPETARVAFESPPEDAEVLFAGPFPQPPRGPAVGITPSEEVLGTRPDLARDSLPHLMARLGERNDGVVRLLSQIGAPAVPELVTASTREDRRGFLARHILRTIAEKDPPGRAALFLELESGDAARREVALYAVNRDPFRRGHYEDPRYTSPPDVPPALGAAFRRSTNDEYRLWAIGALDRCHPGGVEVLRMLESERMAGPFEVKWSPITVWLVERALVWSEIGEARRRRCQFLLEALDHRKTRDAARAVIARRGLTWEFLNAD